ERKLPEQQVLPDSVKELSKREDALAGAAREWAETRYGAKAREVVVRFDKEEGKLAVPAESDLDQRARKLQAQAMIVYLKNQEQKVTADLLAANKITAEDTKRRAEENRTRLKKLADAAVAGEAGKVELGFDANYNLTNTDDVRRVEAVIGNA